ncbi:hypothetical protein ASF84_09930 [Pseudomonas sp. Leaf127]|uniref:DMT family transporter n=1 Tax=Pseudomonas TaxID=286 RepID=UPI000703B6AC|nr:MULTISPECIES: DMT family transporter [Pseudomonas]KQQ56327.1 hypothetical protein ASF84_09930 [Pseudomonas sp. Leaf127]
MLLTALAMLAFAANSLLCRVALRGEAIDPVAFTLVRLLSGALALWLISSLRTKTESMQGNWKGALSLFVYALGFAYAYVQLDTGTGALLLFGAVQMTIVGYGLFRGERLSVPAVAGLLIASAGLVALLLPGSSAPPLISSMIMIIAGMAWGIYSILGKGASSPLGSTTGNFMLAIPAIVLVALLQADEIRMTLAGVIAALVSGAIASGIGYALWYRVMPRLGSFQAASVQLSVPVLASVGGLIFLGESLSLRLVLASCAVLVGITLVLMSRRAQVRSN